MFNRDPSGNYGETVAWGLWLKIRDVPWEDIQNRMGNDRLARKFDEDTRLCDMEDMVFELLIDNEDEE